MSSGLGIFKSKIFGGFNRDDVVNYIEKLANERNNLLAENAKLKERIDGLIATAEAEAAEREAAALHAKELVAEAHREKDEIIAETVKTIDAVLEKYETIKAELSNMTNTISGFSDSIASAGTELNEIRSTLSVDSEKGI